MINIFHRSREFVEKHKQHHHLFLAVLALVIAGTGAYTYRHEVASAATFYFTQSSTGLGGGGWTGLDTSTPLATHTSNQSNWSKYSALSTYINADANGISLPSSAKPITDDGAGLSAKTDYTTGANPYDVTISPDGTSVYVVNYSDSTVSMYSRNTSTGALSAKTDYTTGTFPRNGITISPDGTSVYVANGGASTVSMFTRNTSTGALSAKTDYTTGTSPRGVTISADGTSVYVANYGVSTVSMYSRNTSTGTLSAKTDYTTGTNPYDVTISPDGTSVYVTNYTSNTVSMFARNTSTGTLSAKTDYTTGQNPYDVTISPDGTSVYVVNNTTGSVSMYSRNITTGALTALGTPTIATGSSPQGVTISPDGTSVYVANSGASTVSMFTRNTSTGALSAKTDYTTGTSPRGVTISADGTSVYVANYGSPIVSMYSRGARGGAVGFESGTNSNTAVSGSGSSASVRLGDTSTGGTKTTSGAYTICTFTSSGTFTPVFSGNLEALVVGGGGGGGKETSSGTAGGGGGGAGGVVYNPAFAVVSQQAYTVTIGPGGAGSTCGSCGFGTSPTNGTNSVFGSITATGGGRGGYSGSAGTRVGLGGGSGGGGLGATGFGATGGVGASGQGNLGGDGFLGAGTTYAGGGGGGADSAGSTATSNVGGNGGSGIVNSIVGSTVGQNISGVYYLGGGGGGFAASGAHGVGGSGGGGSASQGFGTVNTGGGGGGGAYYYGGGAGGSGIVVVKYLSPLSGTFMSSVIDTGAKSNFTTISVASTTSTGVNAITIDIRAGDSATAPSWGLTDANWTSTGISVANGGSIAGLGAHRYVQYRANLSTNDWSISPTLDNVVINSTQYSLGGDLTSSVFDTVDATNVIGKISWTSTGTTADEIIKLQVRSASTTALLDTATWCGPSTACTGSDYFLEANNGVALATGHPLNTGSNDRYLQYKAYLVSGGANTPTITGVSVQYVVNASPVVANVTATQISDPADTANYGKVSFSFDASDSDTASGTIPYYVVPTLYRYSTDGGSSWTTIPSGELNASAYTPINITSNTATANTAVVWTPTTVIARTTNAKIEVTVDDREGANRLGVGTQATPFTLDRTPPAVSTANMDSSGTQDVVNLTATDGSTLEYRLCNNDFFTGCATWSSITSGVATSTNWSASGSPGTETVYLQVRDLYGNVNTTPTSIVAPATPSTNFISADVSNPSANTFGETLSWVAVTNATTYDLYYATTTSASSPTPSAYTSLVSQAGNTYPHIISPSASSSAYWYKVRAVTSTATGNNISNYASIIPGDVPDSFGISLGDSVAPVINSIATSSVLSTSAIVTIVTNEIASGRVYYGTGSSNGTNCGNYTSSTPPSVLYATSTSITLTGLSPTTTYFFCVTTKDPTGNTSSGTDGGSFTTATGPTITSVSLQNLTGNSVTITWNTATTSDSYVHYSTSNSLASPITVGSAVMVSCSGPGVCSHQVGLSGLASGTDYYYEVKSTDPDSNSVTKSDTGGYYFFHTLADTTAPALVGNIETPVKAPTAAVIVWQTDEPATSQVKWGLASTTLTRFTVNDATKSIYHVVTLSSGTLDTNNASQELTPEITYYFTVTSADAANNSMTSSVQSFTTPASGNVTITVVSVRAGDTKDTTPPAISNVTVSDITPFSAVVKFSTDEDTVAGVDAGATQTYGQTASSFDWGKTQTIKLRGLTLGTEYHIRVKAVDKAGNTGTSADQTFKTTFLSENLKDMANVENIEQFQKEIENAIESILPSLVPPFVTKPIVSDITESGAKVSFKTNIKAFPVVVYAEDGAYDETKDDPYTGEVSDTKEKATTHELALTGLKGNTKYHIQARAFSLPKVLGKSVDVTFITKASKIAGSIVERKKDSFTVVWTTDQPTTSIVEFKDLKRGVTERKTDDARKTSHSMKIENLPSGTAYEVNLSGLTEQGNIAEAGSPLSVTTSTDTIPPAISGFKVDNALVPGRTDRIQTIVSWVTDEPSNSTAYYQEGAGAPGDTKELANKNESLDSFITAHSVILPNLKPGTIYRLKVTSSDDSGNEGSFGPRTVITPKQTESITDIIFKNFEDSFKFMRKI